MAMFPLLVSLILCIIDSISLSSSYNIVKTCNITDYGAKGNNKTDNTKSIQLAIEDCAKAAVNSNNGDQALVLLPYLYENNGLKETVYVSGALWLDTNIAFKIEKNVRLLGSADKTEASYPWIYTRYGGTMQMSKASLLNGGYCSDLSNYDPLKIGDQCKNNWNKLQNIKIFGYGVIDGNGHSGWYNGPYSGSRPCLLQLMWINGLNIFNVTLTNSPFWTLHPLFSNNILIENITIETDGPNTDGIDPDSCSNVLITKSYINSGDDCIAIKSGKNADGRAVGIPSNNITVIHMIFGDGRGISIGSEMSGNVTNVLFANFGMNNTLRGPRIKSERGRGGMVANITYSNITMENVETGISITEYYSSSSNGVAPIFKDIYINNLTGSVTKEAGEFLCLPESPCYYIQLNHVHIIGMQTGFKCQYAHGDAIDVAPKSCLNTTQY